LIRFNAENDRSAEAVDTGSVAKMVYNFSIFGYIIGLHIASASMALVGTIFSLKILPNQSFLSAMIISGLSLKSSE
jgi:hypothetical protein